MKKMIKLTEDNLKKIVNDSVNKVIKEGYYTQGDIDNAFNRFQQQGLQQIRNGQYGSQYSGQQYGNKYGSQMGKQYGGQQYGNQMDGRYGNQYGGLQYSRQYGEKTPREEVNYDLVEALLDKSYNLLEKYRVETTDGPLAQVLNHVASWISQAKSRLDAYFLE